MRILLLEDSEDDALLLLHKLKKSGYETVSERVDTREDFEDALDSKVWDVITADYAMPYFDGLSALDLLKKKKLDIPFIIVSGKIGEELAVEAMRRGACDYILKNNLKRLVPTIEREIREAENRRQQRLAEEALHLERERLGELADHINGALLLLDDDATIVYANRLAGDWFGPLDTLKGKRCTEILNTADPMRDCAPLRALELGNSIERDVSIRITTGENKIVHISATPVRDGDGTAKQVTVMLIDVTERKQAEQLNRALNDINTAINSTLDIEEILHRVLVEGSRVLEAEAARVFSYEHNYWVLRDIYGVSVPEEVIGLRLSEADMKPMLLAAKFKRPVVVSNSDNDVSDGQASRRIIDMLGDGSLLNIPLVIRNNTIGVITYSFISKASVFTEAQMDFAEKVGATVSLALENARLFEEQKKAADDVRESRRQVLDILESITDGFFALDSLWRVTYINSKAQQFLDIRKEDILFKKIWDKLPNAQVLRLFKELHHVAEQKVTTSFEEFLPSLGKWFEFHVYPYQYGISVYFSDITDRQNMKKNPSNLNAH